jgi:hypothetical protein
MALSVFVVPFFHGVAFRAYPNSSLLVSRGYTKVIHLCACVERKEAFFLTRLSDLDDGGHLGFAATRITGVEAVDLANDTFVLHEVSYLTVFDLSHNVIIDW